MAKGHRCTGTCRPDALNCGDGHPPVQGCLGCGGLPHSQRGVDLDALRARGGRPAPALRSGWCVPLARWRNLGCRKRRCRCWLRCDCAGRHRRMGALEDGGGAGNPWTGDRAPTIGRSHRSRPGARCSIHVPWILDKTCSRSAPLRDARLCARPAGDAAHALRTRERLHASGAAGYLPLIVFSVEVMILIGPRRWFSTCPGAGAVRTSERDA